MRIGAALELFVKQATVTPAELATYLYGSDPEAYKKACARLGRLVDAGHIRRVCRGVYQRSDWKAPSEVLPKRCTIAEAAAVLYGDSSKREAARQAMLRAGMRPIKRGVYAKQY